MPRKGPAVKREIDPDPIYQNQLVTQLINKMLLSGKRSLAERIVYKALEDISEGPRTTRRSRCKRAVENVRPLLEVRSRPGRRCDVPGAGRGSAAPRNDAGLRWLVNYSRAAARALHGRAPGRGAHGRGERAGASVKRSEDMHKMAEANKAFAHYRW